MTFTLDGLGPDQKRELLARLLRERGTRELSRHPLAHNQQALWFLSQFAPHSAAHHVAFAARVRSALSITALTRALAALAARHGALRTQFRGVEGAPVQEILPAVDLTVERVDVGALDDEGIRRLVQTAYAHPFDLGRAPLSRATVFSRGDDDHVLLLVVHHIIADYWSMVVLVTELLELYAADREQRPAALPDPPPPFTDHVHACNAALAGEEGRRLWDYWRRVLADAPVPPPFAGEQPHPRDANGTATHRFDVPLPLMLQIRELARGEGVTPFIVLVAAFHVLIGRHTGAGDVVVGSLAAGRTRARFRNTVGNFVNPVAVRVRLDGDPTVRELLARTREAGLGALRNQELPYTLLIERLNPIRSSRHSALARSFFVLQNLPLAGDAAALVAGRPGGRTRQGGLDLEAFPIAQQEGEWEIVIEATELADGLACELKYRTAVFSAGSAARLARHYVRLLAGMVDGPGRHVGDVEMLDPEERDRQLVEWNRTGAPLPGDRRVTDWLDEHARTRPNAPAISEGSRSISYIELRDVVERAARRLALLGARPDSIVAVYADRGIDLIATLLAVHRAGSAFLALDPRHPQDRNFVLIESSGAEVLVVEDRARHAAEVRGAATQRRVVSIAELLREDPVLPSMALSRPGARDLAYVIFTSGSTGAPKGAMVETGGMLNHLLAKVEDLRLGARDVVAQTASTTFDISVWQCFAAIIVGGTTAVVDDEAALVPRRLVKELERQRITVLELVPSVLRLVINEAAGSAAARDVLGRLRFLLSTGESLTPELCRLWFGVCPHVPLVNAYGPTECSDDVTHAFIAAPPPASAMRVTIGRPIRNTRLYVLGPDGALLPEGAPGELNVGGAGVGRGYLADAERTRRAFVPDRFGGSSEERLYRTGDRVRWLADGTLELIGRIDEQVKVRGHRIEPGEIESVLETHDGVRAAAVALRADARGEPALIAWIVPAGPPPRAEELRAFLRERLPEAMVPLRYVCLDRLPTTSNAKIDRAALQVPDDAPAATFVPPRSRLEAAIAEIWADVLKRDRISVHDDFFDLGGHSLAVTQIAFRLRERFNVDVPLVRLFEQPTVAGLAAVVEELSTRPSNQPAPRAAADAGPSSELASIDFHEDRIAEQIVAGKLPPVEAANLSYLPDAMLSIPGLDRRQIIDGFCRNRPYVSAVFDTGFGRIASVVLPRFASECYGDPEGLSNDCAHASALAWTIGARIMSLGGILASATDYGRSLEGVRGDHPPFSTGHATTAAAVVLAIRAALERAGRDLRRERVAFVGLGSVGVSTLRLMLRRLPHPAVLLLCEVYRRRDALEALRSELRDEFGFAGEIHCLASHQAVGAGTYEATLIVGATNVPDVLDVARLAPGTIIVDDSAPHCFPLAAAVQRFEENGDVLFTEGGTLQLPEPFTLTLYYPAAAERAIGVSREQLRRSFDPREITGCVLSSLLSVRRPHLLPVLGVPDVAACEAHLDTLRELRGAAFPIRCHGNALGEVYAPSEAAVARFRERFGERPVIA